jgi:hypothetical protein
MAEPVFIHPSKRYRLYFDETGNGHLRAYEKDAHQRYLSLTGLVIPQEVHDGDFTNRLNALKADIFGGANASSIVLHRRDIMQRKGVFSVLKDNDLRQRFNAALIDFVGELCGPAITVSIDKQEHAEKYDVWHFSPYHYVLTCLVERFVRWLDDHDCVGDVLGEARSAKHDAQLRRSFRRFYDKGTTVPVSMIQSRLTSREIRLEPKESNIAALQICDMLAHPCHRAYKFEKLGMPQPDDYGARMAALVKFIYRKSPYTGRIEGYGRKWLP